MTASDITVTIRTRNTDEALAYIKENRAKYEHLHGDDLANALNWVFQCFATEWQIDGGKWEPMRLATRSK